MSLFLFIFRSIPANIPNFATNNVERIQLVSVAGISTLSASQMCVSSLNDTRPSVYQRLYCRFSNNIAVFNGKKSQLHPLCNTS